MGIAIGGALGGVILSAGGAGGLPLASMVLIAPVLVIVVLGRRHAFPSSSSR